MAANTPFPFGYGNAAAAAAAAAAATYSSQVLLRKFVIYAQTGNAVEKIHVSRWILNVCFLTLSEIT